MELVRVIKKRLVMGLDVNEVPTGWHWEVDRVLRFEEGGNEVVVHGTQELTAEEVQTHLSAALLLQAADIAADSLVRDELQAELTATKNELITCKAELANLKAEKSNEQ